MISIISKINEYIWGWPFVLLLVVTSIYLSIKLRFPQIKILLALKDIFKNEDKNNKNKITSFKSLMTVLAGTLGTGNITGVATAIAIGGIGSLFWMFVSGVLAMVISYAENYIVLKYRRRDRYKGFYGGTMYVLEEVLDKKKIAVFFALLVAISAACTGTMTQSNSLSTLINTSTNVSKEIVGIVLAVITAYIVFGGKRRLAKVSSIVIPICTVVYIILCVSIIYMNRNNVVPGLKLMVLSAIGIKQVAGGIVGLTVSKIIGRGFSIGMFSNEAGMGSAPIFTATVEENDIEKEARIAATSVIIDTLILCMLTGITIVSTGYYNVPNVGEMLNKVFNTVPYGVTILNICMVFFVVSTIPCWEYYGEEATKYLFKSNLSLYIFRIMYIIGIYVGSIMTVSVVWDLAGIANAVMTLPNLYMIYKCVGDISNKRVYKEDKV